MEFSGSVHGQKDGSMDVRMENKGTICRPFLEHNNLSKILNLHVWWQLINIPTSVFINHIMGVKCQLLVGIHRYKISILIDISTSVFINHIMSV